MIDDGSKMIHALMDRLHKTIELENNLYKSGLDPKEWYRILMEKSKLIRDNFLQNQKIIDEVFIPFQKNPALMSDRDISDFSLIIYNLNAKEQIIDSFLMYDFATVLYQEMVKRKFPMPQIINTLAIVVNAGTFLFNIECDKACIELSRAMFDYGKHLNEIKRDTLDGRRARKNLITNTFMYLYQIIDIHYLSNTHNYTQVYFEIQNVLAFIEFYRGCDLSNEERALLDSNLHSIIILILDMLITFNRSSLHGQIEEFSPQERESEMLIINRALPYLSKYLSENENDVESRLRLLYVQKSLQNIDVKEYYHALKKIYENRPILINLENLYETYAYDYYVICPALLMDVIYEKQDLLGLDKRKECNELFLNTIMLLEKNKKNVSNRHLVKITTDFIHDTFVYLENENDVLVEEINDLFFHQQLFTALHQKLVSEITLILTEGLIQADISLFDGTYLYHREDSFEEKKEKILHYAKNAGLLHDFGKIKYYDIINMQYRKVTDSEFETIKRHPVTGYELLDSNLGLKQYAPVARKHHVFYNQLAGYPQAALNQKTQYDIFVDIVSVADAIDAATDILGRNYAQGKSFRTIYEELVQMKGTRYRPAVVEVMERNPEVKNRLASLIDVERRTVYENCYLNYLSK